MTREAKRKWLAQYRTQRASVGLCIECNSKAVEGNLRCARCRERNRESAMRIKLRPDGWVPSGAKLRVWKREAVSA